jgi:hypothetical protein
MKIRQQVMKETGAVLSTRTLTTSVMKVNRRVTRRITGASVSQSVLLDDQ